jgi:hypothetical protein
MQLPKGRRMYINERRGVAFMTNDDDDEGKVAAPICKLKKEI